MPTTDRKGRAQLLPAEALRAGWRSWIGLLVVSGGALIAVLLTQPGVSAAEGSSGGRLAGSVLVGVSIAWLVLLGAAVLLLRSYCFRAVWDGRPVEAGSYLKGMYQVWGVLVVGALLGVLGAVLMGAVLPGGLVAMGAVLMLVFSRPSGRALGV
ncbi:MAG: hypothetical protein ACPGYV_11035 [Phycisphaeraceae bacterium]